MYEGIFWFIVRLLLGRRDVTLGKSTPPKGWHFRAFCLLKCHYATLKLFGLSCFQPYPIGHTRKIASSLFLFYLSIFQWYFESHGFLACVASVSVWFRSKERPRNGILGSLAARQMKQEPRASFLPHPLPALLLTPFFARCLTLVPLFLLLNRTETLATQARLLCSKVFFQDTSPTHYALYT